MAPALPLAPREPPDCDPAALDIDKYQRQILASVDNLANHMENNATGAADQPGQVKNDAPGLEMILGDLSNNELFQVIKTLETQDVSAEALSIFPLDVPENTEQETTDSLEDKIIQSQSRIERRCAFLLRRLRILQAREIGKRVSEEVTQTFEKCLRGARKDGAGRPMGMKALLKKVETTAALQASAASRSVAGPKYYNPGTSKGDASRSASIGIASGSLAGLEDTAGALRSHLSMVKHELDSDATLSSSGAESNDEAVPYNNPHQQPMPIEKRALWVWQRERASIASRWSWLHAHVQELDYKIRQHTELLRQVREAKGAVEFEGDPAPPAGYSGALPGAGPDPDPDTCARIRPLRRDTFKKRKLLRMHELHLTTNKAAKTTDIRCSCEYPVESCPVCTGRPDPTLPPPALDTLPPRERLAHLDPCYHPVLSDIKDVSAWAHMSALCSRGWFRARRPPAPAAPHAPAAAAPPLKRHPLRRGRPPLSRKIIREREREREEDNAPPMGHESSRGRGAARSSTESRALRRPSYDIDSIVIPHSVAAATRPQILTYKEIITPKWRVNEIPEVINNGYNTMYMDESDEDVSELAVSVRHARASCRERAQFARHKRRAHHNAEENIDEGVEENASASTRGRARQHRRRPTDTAPAPAPATPPAPATLETVKPYSPREFPLPDATYEEMVSAMPEGHRPPSPAPPPPPSPPQDGDDSSTLSPVSPSAYEGDDPDDLEWEPSVEKTERRKSAFR